MFFFIVCGEQTFTKELKAYQDKPIQCHGCGHMNVKVKQRRPFFTLCFIPIIPFTISGFKDIVCQREQCKFIEPLENRRDVMAMANIGGDGHPTHPPSQQHQMQGGPPPTWGGQQYQGPYSGQPQQYHPQQGPPPGWDGQQQYKGPEPGQPQYR